MKKRILSLIITVTMLATTFPQTTLAKENDLDITRVAGDNRYSTSVEASKREFSNSNYVILASGEDYADALVGGSLAVSIKAPLLLSSKLAIPTVTLNEIKRLNPKEVFVLGGEGTLSKNVETKLKNSGYKVERLSGKDRYETAIQVAQKRYTLTSNSQVMGDLSGQVDGYNFKESLPAASFIGKIDGVYMIPYKAGGLPPYIAIGGVPKNTETYRYTGSNPYATAVEVAKGYKEILNQEITTVVLVDGTNYPDSLSASTVCIENNTAVLLTNPATLSQETKDYIENNTNIRNIVIVGGVGSVSKNVVKELQDIR